MRGPNQPTQDAGSRLLIPNSTVDGLAELTHGVAELLDGWKQQSSQIQIPKYRRELKELSVTLDDTSQAYEGAVREAEEESKLGAVVARDAVDLVDQLLIPGISPDEIKELLADLVKRMDDLVSAAKQLKEEFLAVRKNLLRSKQAVAALEDGVTEYRDAAVSLGRKFIAALYSSTAFVVPLMSNKAKKFSATANRDARFAAAQTALTILEGTERRLDNAIEVVGKHIDEWSLLHTAIKAISSNDLVKTNGGVLKKCRRRWSEIEQQFKNYASEASIARQQLENTKENARRDTRSLPKERGRVTNEAEQT